MNNLDKDGAGSADEDKISGQARRVVDAAFSSAKEDDAKTEPVKNPGFFNKVKEQAEATPVKTEAVKEETEVKASQRAGRELQV